MFVDGDDLDADLFKALRINQRNLDKFFNATNDWSNREKTDALISATERGNNFEDIAGFIATCRALDWETMQFCIAEMQKEMQEFYP